MTEEKCPSDIFQLVMMVNLAVASFLQAKDGGEGTGQPDREIIAAAVLVQIATDLLDMSWEKRWGTKARDE